MASPHVLLFADELADKLASTRRLYAVSKCRPQLRRFLEEATDVVQWQLSALTPVERRAFGHFTDLIELAEHYASQDLSGEIAGTVLINAIQIGELLLLAEDDSSLLNSGTFEPCQLGFGVGLLAASVAAAARDTNQVVKLGLETIAIGFRLGLQLNRRARCVEDSTESWRCLLPGTSPADIESQLAEFNTTLPVVRHAYIGVVTQAWTTIFAPPSTVKMLFKCEKFADMTKSPLSSANSIHAAHLPPMDILDIVGDSTMLDDCRPLKTVYSSSTRKPFQASSLRELLRLTIIDIAHERLWLEDTVKSLGLALKGSPKVTLTTVGSTPHTQTVQRILQQDCDAVDASEGTRLSPSADHVCGGSDRIAIVGMSGRFPGSDNIDEFWELLEAGTATHEEIPSSRFSVEDFFDSSERTKNAVLTRFGCFLKAPGDFDNRFFNISPREALQMDPVQRMLLMTTYEALEMAGYAQDSTGSSQGARIAAYFGQTTDDWKTINDQQGIDTHYLPCSNRVFAPGRLSHYFKWGGGFYSIDTGCSSSSTCICLACNALMAKECDAAIAGGGSLLVAPEWYSGLSKGGFLSPSGACKPFADTADGYCRGEAVAVVVLKRLEDALKSNDNILAVINATARNSNAGSGSITHPGEAAQEALYRKVLRQSCVGALDVNFVEMHGTGTQAGDRVEMNSVRKVFAPGRASDNPLTIGAVKANVGHSGAAAGVVSLIKMILALRKNKIPPQPGWPFTLNPNFQALQSASIRIADGHSQLVPRPTGDGKRNIIVNGFDAAGGNTCLLIQDPPLQRGKSQDPRSHHVIVCSGRTPTSHKANKARLRQYLSLHPETRMADLAYTTTARRLHEVHRDAYVSTSIEELVRKLDGKDPYQPLSPKSRKSLPVFVFTGQSSQYTGMGARLYETCPSFRRLIDSYQAICDCQGQAHFLDIIRGTQDVATATASQTQLAIVALEIALAHYWHSLGLQPGLVIGHSLGEYAALCVAGVLSVSDTLYLVHERALLIQEQCVASSHAMLAVSLAGDTVRELLNDTTRRTCQIACLNGPSMTVVSGKSDELASLQAELGLKKVKVTQLSVEYGFHSSQMDPILDSFESIASRIHFRTPAVPVASTLYGKVVQSGHIFDAAYLRRQMRDPVDFLGAVRACEADGLLQSSSLVLEIGPHPVCINLLASSLQEAQPTCFASLERGQDDWRSISTCLAGAHVATMSVDWQEFHKDYLGFVRLLNLPSYAFDLKSFWVPYRSQAVQPQERGKPGPKAVSHIPSTSLQTIESLRAEEGRTLATFASRVSEANLLRALAGHVVDGVAICPASIFVDMAYTAVIYLLREHGSTALLPDLELINLDMTRPLIIQGEGHDQTIRVEAVLDEARSCVSVRFSSSTGAAVAEHASARVRLDDRGNSWKGEWSRMQNLVKARVNSLTESSRAGATHRMNKALIYRLFAAIVEYERPYQAIEEVNIPPNFEDAAARLALHQTDGLGTFTCSPFAIDALVHLAGFLLNADPAKPKYDIHIANHIGYLRVLDNMSTNRECMCYASIRERNSKGITVCDVYVFEKDRLVALCTDIRFQKLDRAFFATMVGKHDTATSQKSPGPQVRVIPHRRGQTSDRSLPETSEATPGSTTPSSQASSMTSTETCDLPRALLNAVASRTGVSLEEMESDMAFADLGIDSQMSITIIADFRKQTGVELPAAFFSNFLTVSDAKAELDSASELQEELVANPVIVPAPKQAKTPKVVPRGLDSSILPGKVKDIGNPSQHLLRMTAETLGIEPGELVLSTTFESAGLDSMLSINILSSFKKETGIELPAAFFNENPTVAAVQKELDEVSEEPERPEGPTLHPAVPDIKPESRAILMQGKSRSTAAPLFLTTDGSGSTESYIHLRPLPHGRRIYALESPFVERPEDYTLTVEEMADVFIDSIRKIQPHGPYLLGGWSAGGIYAYEIAYRLAQLGERVNTLIIMDMRVPSLIPSAVVTLELVERIGAFEGVNRARNLIDDLSNKQKRHLMSTCRALAKYVAKPFADHNRPRTAHLVWATKGLNDNPDPSKRDKRVTGPAAMGRADSDKPVSEMTVTEFEVYFKSWFYGKRYQFGTNGWEKLLGNNISVHKVEGDHFSMMAPPVVQDLGTLVVDSVTRSVEQER